MFNSAADRIEYSQAVDYLDQGRADLIPADKLERYLSVGLLQREGAQLRLTEVGKREYQTARNERTAEG
ncbi:hypothetical protein OOT46_23230 [Aquabacterium sp. A7-Y]|uniref:hypothetical protein n=1 Tax=Aquabacterium sp. A7-Y TaxID=1349605 RepID=UPI00223D3FC7|nr:hypothetical protein [Aquabacterium sp. A7-Y]MCW7540736.1 hypothetical protein [Aquabacterium sp. A7-Y]